MRLARSRQHGMAAVFLLMLLATAAIVVVLKRSDPSPERDLTARNVTQAKLAAVEQALAAFVIQYKRLPCPALGRSLSSQVEAEMGKERRLVFTYANATYEVCQVTGVNTINNDNQKAAILSQQFQTDGVVPWRELGLKRSDVLDGWGNLLTYRVAPDLAKSGSMDLSSCHPNGTGPLASSGNESGRCKSCQGASMTNCTPPGTYTLGKGLTVMSSSSQTLMTPGGTSATNNGAAYVVISHGENAAGSYSALGIAQSGSPAAGTLETPNAATAQFSVSPYPSFYDATPSLDAGTSYFDDLILRPRIVDVANAASLGPRMR